MLFTMLPLSGRPQDLRKSKHGARFLATNQIKKATQMYDIGSYESCLREASKAFKYATLSFTAGWGDFKSACITIFVER